MGVQGVRRSGAVLRLAQQAAQLGVVRHPVLAVRLEYLRDRPPARPPRQHVLLRRGGWSGLGIEALQQADRVQVRPGAGLDPRRGVDRDARLVIDDDLRRRGRYIWLRGHLGY